MNSCIALTIATKQILGGNISIGFVATTSSNEVKITAFDTSVDVPITDKCSHVSVTAQCANKDVLEKSYEVRWDSSLLNEQQLLNSIELIEDGNTSSCCEGYGDCLEDLVGLTSSSGCSDCEPYNNIPNFAIRSLSGYYLDDIISFNQYFLTDCNGRSNWDILNNRVKNTAVRDLLADITACMGNYKPVTSHMATETSVGTMQNGLSVSTNYNQLYAGHTLYTKNSNGGALLLNSIIIGKVFNMNNTPFIGTARLKFYIFKDNDIMYSFDTRPIFDGRGNITIDLSEMSVSIKLDGSRYSIIWRTYDYDSGSNLKPANVPMPKMHDGFRCGCNSQPPTWVCGNKSEMPEGKCTYNKFVALGISGTNLSNVKSWGGNPGQKAVGFAQSSGGISSILMSTVGDCSIENLICGAINDNKDIRNTIAYALQRKMAIKAADLIMSGVIPDSYFQIDSKKINAMVKVYLQEYNDKMNGFGKNKSICKLLSDYIEKNLCSMCVECDSHGVSFTNYNNI